MLNLLTSQRPNWTAWPCIHDSYTWRKAKRGYSPVLKLKETHCLRINAASLSALLSLEAETQSLWMAHPLTIRFCVLVFGLLTLSRGHLDLYGPHLYILLRMYDHGDLKGPLCACSPVWCFWGAWQYQFIGDDLYLSAPAAVWLMWFRKKLVSWPTLYCNFLKWVGAVYTAMLWHSTKMEMFRS